MAEREWWGQDVVPRIRWRIDAAEGAEIPHGYGIAYYEYGNRRMVCMPLPINIIVGAWREFVWHLKCHPFRFGEARAEIIRKHAWDKGYSDGLADGRFGIMHRENPYRRKRS